MANPVAFSEYLTSSVSYTVPAGKIAYFSAFASTANSGVSIGGKNMYSIGSSNETAGSSKMAANAGQVIAFWGTGAGCGINGILVDA